MSTRVVEGYVHNLDDTPWVNAVVRFILNPGSYTSLILYPRSIITTTTDESGKFSIRLWANEEGESPSTITCFMPSGESFNFILPAGEGSINLGLLRKMGQPTAIANNQSLISFVESLVVQKGGAINDSTKSLTVAFNWNDPSPKNIFLIPSGTTLLRVAISISQAFNGSNPLLSLGDMSNPSRLIMSSDINPSSAAEYEFHPRLNYINSTELILTISPSPNTSQGQGFVVLEF